MNTVIICSIAFSASLLTLFSGFGLGTILLPVFAVFFPIPLAIGATAVVHLANNLFKVFLVGKDADWKTVLRFAIPASIAAIGGALLLKSLEGIGSLSSYHIGQRAFDITALNLTIGIVIVAFAVMEFLPQCTKLSFPSKYLPIGGILSGFFGGLTGLQGALRSAFLIRAGLSREQFIGTGVVAAVIVDISRLLTYGVAFYSMKFGVVRNELWTLVILATLSAFAGAFLGKKLIRKITIATIQKIIAVMLVVFGLALAFGLV